jgi:hypothetical protein
LILAFFAAPAAAQPNPAVALAEVRFSFGEGVLAEDQTYIREAIRLAQDYLPAAFGISLQHTVFVGAVAVPCSPDVSSPDCPPRGVSDGHGIAFNTAHPFWVQAPPLLRVKIAVHEYVHVFEREFTWGIPEGMPGWLWEGMGELVGYRALAARGLVSYDAALAFNVWVAVHGAAPPADATNAAALWRYSQPYGEAFLHLGVLATRHGLEALRAYFEWLSQGGDHATAFAAAFGESPAEFDAAYAR